MEVTILEETKNRLVIELKGEDHTLCNALRRELWDQKDVKAAAYNIDHPVVGHPKLIIETSGKDPKAVLQIAIESLKKKNNDLLKKFEKEF